MASICTQNVSKIEDSLDSKKSLSIICSADHFFLNEQGKYIFDPKMIKKAHINCKQKFEKSIEQKKIKKISDFILIIHIDLGGNIKNI